MTNSTNGSTVEFTLNWREPFNGLDPIVNYTVSCSGDVTCPPNFTTTDNTTRSYTITNLTTMTNYTFSVVATNSIGSGEAGVVMLIVEEVINATIAPSVVSMSTITPSEGMTTTSTMGTMLTSIAISIGSSIATIHASTSAIKTTATATTTSTITTAIVPSMDESMISTSSSENMMTITTTFIATTSTSITTSNTIPGDILHDCKCIISWLCIVHNLMNILLVCKIQI